MKTISALAVALALLLPVPFSGAGTAAAQGLAAPRTVTMTGQGTVLATPDLVTLSAGVTTQAPDAATALAQNSSRMQKVFAALKALGVADRDIQTANFSVFPQSSDDGGTSHVTGYQVTNQVQLRLHDTARLGAALDALVAAGANQMNGIDFGIADKAPLLAQARAQAVADAQARAQAYAQAAGVVLGPILSISENGGDAPRPLFMAAPMVRAAKAVPMAAGEESVDAGVTIVWEIR